MLTRRIIPCLDVADGRVVKGVRFRGLRDAGDPVELARVYAEKGADELVLLDITATRQGEATAARLAESVARELPIPFTVGGGIRTVDDMRRVLGAGADKVAINTAAVRRPELISEAAERFGSQAVVVAIDAAQRAGMGDAEAMAEPNGAPSRWEVRVRAGRETTGLDAVTWARRAAELGAGEILLTSFDRDGTKEGYDLELLEAVCSAVRIPVIASGGAGAAEHFAEALEAGAAAALAASLFHYEELTIAEVKRHLASRGILVRPAPAPFAPDVVEFSPDGGLVPAIVQSVDDRSVLMLGWMNRAALDATLESGRVTFYSRSRQELWEKGETSGNWLELRSIRVDCDRDALLLTARPHGPTCHTGRASCFGEAGVGFPVWDSVGGTIRDATPGLAGVLERLERRIEERAIERPSGSYTASLLDAGTERVAQKVGEEAVETVVAALRTADAERKELAAESADLLYHLLVLWRSAGLDAGAVAAELRRREPVSDQSPVDT